MSSLTHYSDPRRSEAAEVGGSARRLDPRPRRQDHAPEEDHVQQEEVVWEQEEEEVAARCCGGLFGGKKPSSVVFGRPGFVVSLSDAVDPRPLVGLVVNWEKTDPVGRLLFDFTVHVLLIKILQMLYLMIHTESWENKNNF